MTCSTPPFLLNSPCKALPKAQQSFLNSLSLPHPPCFATSKTPCHTLRLPAQVGFSMDNGLILPLPSYLMENDPSTIAKSIKQLGYNSLCFYPHHVKTSNAPFPQDCFSKLKEAGLDIQVEILPLEKPSYFSLLPQALETLAKHLGSRVTLHYPASFMQAALYTPEENRDYSFLEKAQKELQLIHSFFPHFYYRLPYCSKESYNWVFEGFFTDLLSLLPPLCRLSFIHDSETGKALIKELVSSPHDFYASLCPIHDPFPSRFGKGLWPELPLESLSDFLEMLLSHPFSSIQVHSPDLPLEDTLHALILQLISVRLYCHLPIKVVIDKWLTSHYPNYPLQASVLYNCAILSRDLDKIARHKDPKSFAQNILQNLQLMEKQAPEDDLSILASQFKYFLRDMRKLVLYELQQKKLSLAQALSGDDLKESFFATLNSPSSGGIPRSMAVELYQCKEEITFDERMKALYSKVRVLNNS